MRFGVTFSFSNYWDWDRFEALERGEQVGRQPVSDAQIWAETLALADLAEPLGYDTLWTIEQHAAPYLMVPDPHQYLSVIAARTKRIDVGSMITVLPWHDPFRLAEQISLLQHVLGPERRYFLGVGRGLARRNFDSMNVDMDTSRERMNEVLDILGLALTQEMFSYQGRFWSYENASVRPQPLDPTVITDAWGAWTSETSLRNMAERGMHPLTTPNKTMESYLEDLDQFIRIRERHGYGPPNRPILEVPMYCCESELEAREGAERFFAEYVDSIVRLYEIGTENFGMTNAYSEYHTKGSDYGDGTAENAMEMLTTKLLNDGIWGTPEQCAERIVAHHEEVDPSELIVFLGTGTMTSAESERAMRLFAERVLPRVAHLRSPTLAATP
jgi:alkanesulfonate monooxygenase SsuD/methylene tetrahydromethanopterin reductase-like flavin-dependent oxidoreductase (luciferase family)